MPERINRVSRQGVELVAEFEGFSAKPYRDAVGVWTIGYGWTRNVGPRSGPWTEHQAKRKLEQALNGAYADPVRALDLPLTQAMFDALVSFVYNLGPAAIHPDTGIGEQLRKRHWRKAADEMLKWNKAGGKVLPGLARRREAERKLFLSDLPRR